MSLSRNIRKKPDTFAASLLDKPLFAVGQPEIVGPAVAADND